MSRGNGLIDFFGEMITDIRQKVVEQGWFGREVTETPPQEPICPPPFDPPLGAVMDNSRYGWAAWKEARDMQEACAAQEGAERAPDQSSPSAPEQGHDIDF